MNLTNYIKDIPNFPKKGILFRDISPLLKSPEGWGAAMRQLGLFCERLNPDLIVGIESRGFISASALAFKNEIGFIPIRKPNKLPGDVIGVNYKLEYGEDRLEIQQNSMEENSKIIVIDDCSTDKSYSILKDMGIILYKNKSKTFKIAFTSSAKAF